MASVTLTGVHKRYADGCHAVRGIDLSVADGELVVLVGPSGCGKSTTLRMIAGLEGVTAGEVRLGERVVSHAAPCDRDLAMVFQDDALYPNLSVRQNLGFGLKMRRTPKSEIDQRVAAAAELLGVGPLLERLPGELSGGERRRVALGRAIVREPAAFLLDEPLSNLDANLRAELRCEIAALHRRLGATMLYVTHDQVEAMTLAQRLVLMDQGRARQVGAPLDVYRRPANRFAATFVGSPAMNLIDGEVRGGRFVAGEATWPVGIGDGPATLGVRPEDLRPAREGEPVFAVGQRLAVESLGHESFVYFQIGAGQGPVEAGQGGPRWVARFAAGAAVPEATPLTFDPAAAHLFAADEAGERLN